jgi:hypothetical protein
MIENMEKNAPNPQSNDDHYLSVDFIESESNIDSADREMEEGELVKVPWREEFKFQDDVLHATDTIIFDRVFTKKARPTRRAPQTKNGLERLATPWGVGALLCFLVANGLLTWAQFSAVPNTPAIASQSLPSFDPLDQGYPHLLNLSKSSSERLSLGHLSHLPQENIKTQPAIANLPVPSSAIPVAIPTQVAVPPLPNNSLTDAVLPPSLQLQMPSAPSSVEAIASVPNQSPPRRVPPKFTVVNPPTRSIPTVAVNPSYTAPRSLSSIPLPPPPPPPTALIQTPTAPPITNNPSSVTAPTVPPNLSASEQISRQITSQEVRMEMNTSPTTAEGFNQKTRKKLQNLYNQSQGGAATSDLDSTKTNSLIQELQQLNQPE